MKIGKICVLVGTLFYVAHVDGQNAEDLLAKTYAAYCGDFTVSMNAKYVYYPDRRLKVATDSMAARFVLHNTEYYFSIGEFELVSTKELFLSVDNDARSIDIYPSASTNQGSGNIQLTEFLSGNGGKTTLFNAGQNLSGVRISYSDRDISQIDLYINESGWITKCVIDYTSGYDEQSGSFMQSRLIIYYSNTLKSNEPLAVDKYGKEKFITINGKNITGRGIYNKYTIENFLN